MAGVDARTATPPDPRIPRRGSRDVASSSPATQLPQLPGFVRPFKLAGQPRRRAQNGEWGQEEPRWNVAIECRLSHDPRIDFNGRLHQGL